MTKNKFDFNMDTIEAESKGPVQPIELNLEKIRTNIPNYTSEKLSEMIAVERYIGFHPEVSVMCMEELSKRRQAGDPFPFEDYIDNSLSGLPKLDFNMLDLRSVLLHAINTNKSKK